MLPSEQSLLSKQYMRVLLATDNHELNIFVGEELILRLIMLGIRMIDGAMRARFGRLAFLWTGSPLQESSDLVIRVGDDEGQVKTLGREAVANYADSDWCHGVALRDKKLNIVDKSLGSDISGD